MALVHGRAGEWARAKGMVIGLWPFALGVFASGFSLAMWFVAGLVWGSLVLALALAVTGLGIYWGMRRMENFYTGARGEERVSAILRDLPSRYHVFNDFTAGPAHIDHVVVGPPGVFAIETKFWNGAVTLEGDRSLVDGRLPSRSPLEQASSQAECVRKTLAKLGWDGVVTPVLAFASDTFAARIAEVRGTVILNSSELTAGFSTERTVIPPAELERLVAIMESDI